MQERDLATGPDRRRHMPHQAGGIAAAAPVRMGADAADLGVAVRLHPFAGHGDQPAVLLHADEGSQPVGAGEIGAGRGQGRQRQHLRRVRLGQRRDGEPRRRRVRRLHRDHLPAQGARRQGRPLRRRRLVGLQQGNRPMRLHQPRQVRQALLRPRRHGGEQAVVGRVAPGQPLGHRHRGLASGQGGPGGPVEGMDGRHACTIQQRRRLSSPARFFASASASSPPERAFPTASAT